MDHLGGGTRIKMKRSLLGWVALAVLATGLGIYVFAPGAIAAVLPYALLAACPVSMLLMMTFMRSDQGTPHEGEVDLAPEKRLAGLKARHAALDEEIGALEWEKLEPSARKDTNQTGRRAR
jgi:hypothetical protein